MKPKKKTLIPTFRRTAKIEQQNTGESIGYDVTNRNIASLQCPIFTPMTYGHERLFLQFRTTSGAYAKSEPIGEDLGEATKLPNRITHLLVGEATKLPNRIRTC